MSRPDRFTRELVRAGMAPLEPGTRVYLQPRPPSLLQRLRRWLTGRPW